MSGEHVPAVLAGAIAAAGAIDNDPARWRERVDLAIPAVAAMMNESAAEWRRAAEVLDATVFVSEYLGHRLEDSSTRIVVDLRGEPSTRRPDGREHVRTDRTDTARGRAMAERLKRLTVSDRLVVWKVNESTRAGDKVRVLAHFELLPPRDDTPPARQPSRPAAGEVHVHNDDEPRRPPPSGTVDIEAFDRLPGALKAAVARKARSEGIAIPRPAPEHAARFAQLIAEAVSS